MKVDLKVTIKIGDQKLTLTENEAKDLRSELNRIFAATYTPITWISSLSGTTTATVNNVYTTRDVGPGILEVDSNE